MKRLITDKTVAVMLEPIQGEAGVWPATDRIPAATCATLTKEHGLLLIFDEIQTGMGRTGKLFHYEHAGIEPDIMTLGKGIGGGVPLAALLATEAASCFEHGDQGGTFNGNPLMCAAGLAVLEHVGDAGLPEIGRRCRAVSGKRVAAALGAARSRRGPRPRAVAGARSEAPIGASIVAQAFEDGVLLNSPQPDALRFMPALNVTREEISRDDRLPRRDPDQGWARQGGWRSVELVMAGALATKQSRPLRVCCFAEPVIGLRFARRGSQ